jgi:hypothetical protein
MFSVKDNSTFFFFFFFLRLRSDLFVLYLVNLAKLNSNMLTCKSGKIELKFGRLGQSSVDTRTSTNPRRTRNTLLARVPR